MAKFKVLVEIVVDYGDEPQEVIDSPIFGIYTVAQKYADLALLHSSVGADSASVVSITEMK
jgi:hypothetical protein